MKPSWDHSQPLVWTSLFLIGFHCTTVLSTGFDGIPGDYCKIRTPEKCCNSRNDECTTPILGNHLCYCDMFCRDHPGNDCCPDFAEVCEGGPARPPIDHERPTAPPTGCIVVGKTCKLNILSSNFRWRWRWRWKRNRRLC